MQLAAAIAWTGIQAFMLALPALTATSAAGGQLRTIVICTGSELKTITLSKDGKPVKTPPETVKCPWGAQLGGVGQVTRPATAPIAPEAMLIGRLSRHMASQFAGSTSEQLFESRAPPCT